MMLNTIVFSDEIKIWWEYVPLKNGENFVVYKNGESYSTLKSHFNFKNLSPNTEYKFKVCKVDKNGKPVKELGEVSVVTKGKKNRIDITKSPYNAVGDGITLNTQAIQAAINDCGKNDCVYIPKGTFLSGALNLKSNVELYLEEEATLLGSTNPEEYLPKIKSRFEGWEMMCYRSLLNIGEMDSHKGCDTENIIIRGGKIWGGGNALRLNIIAKERVAVLKEYGMENEVSPHALYSSTIPGRARGRTICCSNAKNVVIANTYVGNSPAWNVHFIYCEDIVVCGCTVVSKGISNGDGIDPDSTKNCTIFDIEFDTGDDSVAIKSGKNPEGYFIARPTENVNVFDCEVHCGHGIAIGSEMSGGVENVAIWNINVVYGYGIVIKTRAKRGGYIRNIKILHCDLPSIRIGEYECLDDGEAAPQMATVSNIVIRDICLKGEKTFVNNTNRKEEVSAIFIEGLGEGNPVKNVSIKNVVLKDRIMMPYQNIVLTNVENIEVQNVVCEGEV